MADRETRSGWQNIKAQLAEGNVRLRYCGGLVIIIAAASIGYLMLRNSTSFSSTEASQLATVPDGVGEQSYALLDPMQKATPAYDNLLARQNTDTAAAAKQMGDSAVPVMRPNTRSESPPDPPSERDAQLSATSSPLAASQPLVVEENSPPLYPPGDRWQQQMAAKAAAMRNQINLLMAAWQPKEHASLTLAKLNPTAAPARDAANDQTVTSSTQAKHKSERIAIRAGELSYAVLDTAINSDEPGPVTATIVQGELKGTKLLGKIEIGQNAQKAGLHFTSASVPTQPTSIAINAWAVDMETARTALASNVNHHYLLRYGTFFAASFLGGFADALLKGGQRQQFITSPLGTTVQNDAYTTQQLILAGVGNVGKQAAGSLAGLINRPVTITINAGMGIGILYMADLKLP